MRPRDMLRGNIRGALCFAALGVALLLILGTQGASWAMPGQNALGDTVPESIIQGNVQLQRYQPQGDPSWIVLLRLTLYRPGESTPASSGEVTTDAYGQFTYPVQYSGTYDIYVKNFHTLTNLKAGTVLAGGVNWVNFGLLLEGDATNDDAVNTLDYSRLYETFGGSDAAADFNQDGRVNILDYSVLYSNFWLTGPRPVLARPSAGAPLQGTDVVTLTVVGGEAFARWPLVAPVVVDTGRTEVDGVEVHLAFDPTVLQVVDAGGQPANQVEPGTVLGQVIRNLADNAAGEVHYAAGVPFGQPRVAGTFDLARVRFKPLRPTPPEGTTVRITDAIAARAGMPHVLHLEDALFRVRVRVILPMVWRKAVTGGLVP